MKRGAVWVLEIGANWYPFDYAADAIEMAITLANADGLRNRPSEVQVEGAKCGWRTVWKSGRDRHPKGYGESKATTASANASGYSQRYPIEPMHLL
jgi:hypothetical protein